MDNGFELYFSATFSANPYTLISTATGSRRAVIRVQARERKADREREGDNDSDEFNDPPASSSSTFT